MPCSLCSKAAINGRGWCWGHYRRWLRHGDPRSGAAGNGESLRDRIERGLPADRPADACWPWTRGRTSTGYGTVTVPGGGSRHAHTAAFEVFVGPIPAGLEPDHTCRNRPCVNPAHLELVTRSENVRRGWPYRARVAA